MGNALIVHPRSLIVPRRGFRKPARPVLDPNDPINRGLFGCWLFGYASIAGGKVLDISGNGRPATIFTPTGSVATKPSHHGGLSTSFSSGTDTAYAKTSDLTNIGNAVARSYSMWFYITTLDTVFRRAWCQPADDSATDSPAFYIVIHSGASGCGVSINNSGGLNFTGSTGVWYHVAASIVGSTITAYLNGVSLGSATASGVTTNCLNYFARYNANYTQDDFGGRIDHARMWLGRAISAAEALRLYAEPYAGIYESAPRWRAGSAAATFNPGRATGATRTIGGVF